VGANGAKLMATLTQQPDSAKPPITITKTKPTAAPFKKRFYVLLQNAYQEAFSFQGSFEFSADNMAVLANHPIEGGAFYSTNKVSSPATCTLLAVTANQAECEKLMRQCNKFIESTDLFKIVTPYEVLENMTLKGMPRRHQPDRFYSSLGVTLTFAEVMLNNKTRTGKTASPSAQAKVNTGQPTAKVVVK